MAERLTYRDENGKAWAKLKTSANSEETMDFGRISLERLADYEDLGTVEELTEMKSLCEKTYDKLRYELNLYKEIGTIKKFKRYRRAESKLEDGFSSWYELLEMLKAIREKFNESNFSDWEESCKDLGGYGEPNETITITVEDKIDACDGFLQNIENAIWILAKGDQK